MKRSNKMAQYQDVKPHPNLGPGALYTKLTDLLTGAYSVEVLAAENGKSVIFRVWFEKHCDLKQHQQVV